MEIVSARMAEGDGAVVLMLADGAVATVPWPCTSWHAAEIHAWVGSGGVIAPYAPPAASVPEAVTARQARLALHGAGLLDAVETAVAGLAAAERIEWEYAAEIRRDHPLIASLATVLGLSAGEVDTLFITAGGL